MPSPPPDADIWEFDENSIRYELCYTPESIRHPAKMHLPMCREIIKRYTKPGDLVLDCMAGIGTTIIEGILLGRNVIGVEYEQKFVDMAQANIDKTHKNMGFMKGLGTGKIVKGDSRELVKVLGGVWAENNVFSPPFADKVAFQDKQWMKDKVGVTNLPQEYSDNKEDNGNIANLKYNPLEKGNSPDAVIFSPPFSNVTMEKSASDKWQGPDFTQQVYSTDKGDKNQIGNLRYADNGVVNAIVTSPPYSGATKGGGISKVGHTDDSKLKDRCYGNLDRSPNNIENLGYPDDGTVSAIITSPPFANANPCQDVEKAEIQKQKWEQNNVKGGSGFLNKVYSEEKDNIGNMPYKADSIITSPPYSHQSTHTPNQEPTPWRVQHNYFVGHDKETYYSNDLNNCGNYSGQTYLDAMLVIYQQCFAVLKNEGSMILVTKNFTRGGKEVRLDTDTIKLCEMAGFEFVTRHYRKIKNPSFWIQNAIIKWKKKHPDIPPPYPLFEDILVFRKGQQKEAHTHTQCDTVMFSPPYHDTNAMQRLPNTEHSKGGQTEYLKYNI